MVCYEMRTLDRIVQLKLEDLTETADAEECATCRALDCDVLFAIFMTVIILLLLVIVVVYWLKGLV